MAASEPLPEREICPDDDGETLSSTEYTPSTVVFPVSEDQIELLNFDTPAEESASSDGSYQAQSSRRSHRYHPPDADITSKRASDSTDTSSSSGESSGTSSPGRKRRSNDIRHHRHKKHPRSRYSHHYGDLYNAPSYSSNTHTHTSTSTSINHNPDISVQNYQSSNKKRGSDEALRIEELPDSVQCDALQHFEYIEILELEDLRRKEDQKQRKKQKGGKPTHSRRPTKANDPTISVQQRPHTKLPLQRQMVYEEEEEEEEEELSEPSSATSSSNFDGTFSPRQSRRKNPTRRRKGPTKSKQPQLNHRPSRHHTPSSNRHSSLSIKGPSSSRSTRRNTSTTADSTTPNPNNNRQRMDPILRDMSPTELAAWEAIFMEPDHPLLKTTIIQDGEEGTTHKPTSTTTTTTTPATPPHTPARRTGLRSPPIPVDDSQLVVELEGYHVTTYPVFEKGKVGIPVPGVSMFDVDVLFEAVRQNKKYAAKKKKNGELYTIEDHHRAHIRNLNNEHKKMEQKEKRQFKEFHKLVEKQKKRQQQQQEQLQATQRASGGSTTLFSPPCSPVSGATSLTNVQSPGRTPSKLEASATSIPNNQKRRRLNGCTNQPTDITTLGKQVNQFNAEEWGLAGVDWAYHSG